MKTSHNYHCASRFMTDTRSRSDTICALSHSWEDELADASIRFVDGSDTESDRDLNEKPFLRESTATKYSDNRSPWRRETRGSFSSASSAGTGSKTPKSARRRNSNVSVHCKKAYLSKNSSFNATSARKKASNIPRGKWATTGKKNNSKYSWTGSFNEKRVRRSIFTYGNDTYSVERDEENENTGLDTRTRSSSPVDAQFYYSSDYEIAARVFNLKGYSRNNSCLQDSDNLCESREFCDPGIDVSNLAVCSDAETQRENSLNERSDDSDAVGDDLAELKCRTKSTNYDERTSSLVVQDWPKTLRHSSSESTLRASSDSSTNSRKSFVQRTSVRDKRIASQSIELENEVFEIEPRTSTGEIFKTTAGLWIDDETTTSTSVSGNTKTSRNDNATDEKCETGRIRMIFRCLGNLFFTFVKNVILFSILPTAYIAFFIYVQTREHRDGDSD